jgi:hypothetical protein
MRAAERQDIEPGDMVGGIQHVAVDRRADDLDAQAEQPADAPEEDAHDRGAVTEQSGDRPGGQADGEQAGHGQHAKHRAECHGSQLNPGD